ncbi:hypothetical protein CDAR_17711 [Caerostris darwini]|uniref:Uncharacterized protein n=1 Tax=Caerostris darwini TaxID=1538125 RepID=A0AAV4MCL3_9ARAC|nr:hypothetical protein CDAR_17711 [Caerostris darwini]
MIIYRSCFIEIQEDAHTLLRHLSVYIITESCSDDAMSMDTSTDSICANNHDDQHISTQLFYSARCKESFKSLRDRHMKEKDLLNLPSESRNKTRKPVII